MSCWNCYALVRHWRVGKTPQNGIDQMKCTTKGRLQDKVWGFAAFLGEPSGIRCSSFKWFHSKYRMMILLNRCFSPFRWAKPCETTSFFFYFSCFQSSRFCLEGIRPQYLVANWWQTSSTYLYIVSYPPKIGWFVVPPDVMLHHHFFLS